LIRCREDAASVVADIVRTYCADAACTAVGEADGKPEDLDPFLDSLFGLAVPFADGRDLSEWRESATLSAEAFARRVAEWPMLDGFLSNWLSAACIRAACRAPPSCCSASPALHRTRAGVSAPAWVWHAAGRQAGDGTHGGGS
jgi:hypothetical protein